MPSLLKGIIIPAATRASRLPLSVGNCGAIFPALVVAGRPAAAPIGMPGKAGRPAGLTMPVLPPPSMLTPPAIRPVTGFPLAMAVRMAVPAAWPALFTILPRKLDINQPTFLMVLPKPAGTGFWEGSAAGAAHRLGGASASSSPFAGRDSRLSHLFMAPSCAVKDVTFLDR